MAHHNTLVGYKINLVNPDKHFKNWVRGESIRVNYMNRVSVLIKILFQMCVWVSTETHCVGFLLKLGITVKDAFKKYSKHIDYSLMWSAVG